MTNYGAFMTREDGTPFYVEDTLPMALLRTQTFSLPATEAGRGLDLDAFADTPFLYFVRLDQVDGWVFRDSSGGVYRLVAGAFSSQTVSGKIYVFGYSFQPVPEYGVAIFDEKERCILTNETVVLKGVNIVTPSGPQGRSNYLYETVPGRIAIIPAWVGYTTYFQIVGGQPMRQVIARSTGCFFNGSNTIVSANPMGRSSSILPVESDFGSGFAPPYIDCTLYD